MLLGRRSVLAGVGSAVAALAGCAGTPERAGSTGLPTIPPSGATSAYTHVQASGNRVVAGAGEIDSARPVDIEVEGEPRWVLAVGGASSYWTVVTADGTATTHRVGGGNETLVEDHGRVSTPPLASRDDDRVALVDAPADGAAHTHPVAADGALVYVAADGDVVVRRADSETRLDVQAPADVRPVQVDGHRYALYGGRTDRYRHGALGDTTEGSSLVVVDVADGAIDVEVTLDPPTVFEGLSPIAADIDGDGDPELVTTVADSAAGARIRAYSPDGTELATGPVYGPGWRHQLCVAAFGPAGAPELAAVRKPHVERTAEFYRLTDGELAVVATDSGYASHTYGSRNVDGGLAADLNDDGRAELLVPTADRRTLAAVRRVEGAAKTAWSLPLEGPLVTNATGAALDDGRLAVGAGTTDRVRVWQG